MKKYRPKEDIAIETEERDPILRFARELVEYGIAGAKELQQIQTEVDQEILRAVDEVGNVSAVSNSPQGATPLVDTVPPAPINDLSATP